MIEFTKKQAKDFCWLVKPKCYFGDRRIPVQTIMAKNGLAFKTDGSRLHVLKTPDIKDGFYWFPLAMKSRFILVQDTSLKPDCWPDASHLIPKFSDGDEIDYRSKGLNNFDSTQLEVSYLRLITTNADKDPIRFTFFKDALSSGDEFYNIEGPDKDSTVFSTYNYSKIAVIMGLRIDFPVSKSISAAEGGEALN